MKFLIHFGLIFVYSPKSCCAHSQKHFLYGSELHKGPISFFAYEYPIIPTPVIEKMNLSWLCVFGILVKDQLIIYDQSYNKFYLSIEFNDFLYKSIVYLIRVITSDYWKLLILL